MKTEETKKHQEKKRCDELQGARKRQREENREKVSAEIEDKRRKLEGKRLAEEEKIQIEMEQSRKLLKEHQVEREMQQVQEIRRDEAKRLRKN